MTTTKKTILIGEDDFEVRGYLQLATQCIGYDSVLAQDGEEVLNYLRQEDGVDAVLLDIMMPRKDGFDTLREIRKLNRSLPVIMVSDASSTMNVVRAMKSGATDFLSKPVLHDELRTAIERATEFASPPAALEPNSKGKTTSEKVFFGTNRRICEIRKILESVASSEASVLIRGETGAGKEVIARELHTLSPRCREPFLKLNCAALPSELVESELFGYERGAFTGAFQRKLGMFELADGGTILLDEIGDMDFKLQAKLLQVLQDHEFQRIGGKEPIRVDVRVLAATHQDLEDAIANRRFREDLYYRLNVIALELPALRERKDDIIPMADFLIRKNCTSSPPPLTPLMKQAFLDYAWPGNVRELENIVRRFIILRDPDAIVRQLSKKTVQKGSQPQPVTAEVSCDGASILAQVARTKQEAETAAILGALQSTRWNRKRAAALLKIDYKAFLYKMKTLSISDSKIDSSSAYPQAGLNRQQD
jgi:two-component system response regulator AtoC